MSTHVFSFSIFLEVSNPIKPGTQLTIRSAFKSARKSFLTMSILFVIILGLYLFNKFKFSELLSIA